MRIAGIVALLGIFALVGCSSSPKEKAQKEFDNGLRLLESRAYGKADSAFVRVAIADSSSLMGRYGHALVLEREGLWLDALNEYLKLADSNPQFAPAYEGAAQIYWFLREPLECQFLSQRALSLQPDNTWSLIRYIESRIQVLHLREADSIIAAAGSKLSEPLKNLLLAQVSLAAQNAVLSEQQASNALSQPISDAWTCLVAAEYLEQRGLSDSAIAMDARAVAAAKTDVYNIRMDQFLRALRLNYSQHAREVMLQFGGKDTTDAAFCGMLLRYHLHFEQRRGADVTSNTYLSSFPESYTARWLDAHSRNLNGDYLTTLAHISEFKPLALVTNPSPDFYDFLTAHRAMLAQELSDKVSALGFFNEVESWRANQRDFKLTLLLSKKTTGQEEAFAALQDSILTRRGTLPDWLTGLGQMYADPYVRSWDEAEKYYRMALEQAREYRPAFGALVDQLLQLKQYGRADSLYQQYPLFERAYPELKLKRGIAMVMLGKVQDGVALFGQSIPLVRGNLTLYEDMIDALRRKEASAEVDTVIALLANLQPQNTDALLLLARWNNDKREFGKARGWAESGLVNEPQNLDLAAEKARALYGLGERDNAMALFEEILAKEDGNVTACMAYSQILAREKIDERRAGNTARIAFNNDGGSIRVTNNLCSVYLTLGRFDLAKGEALKGINVYPTEPQLYYYLGMTMAATKDKEAKPNLQKAIDLGLWGEELQQASETLRLIS